MSTTRILQEDKGGHTFYLHRVGDRNYPDYVGYEDKDYGDLLKKIRDMEIRSDDVIQIGFPKCGNNWMFDVTSMVLEHSSEYTKNNIAMRFLDIKSLKELDGFGDEPSPRLITSHLNIDTMPDQISTKKPRVIYILRNFKDAAVSMYKWATSLKMMLVYRGEWENYLDLELEGLFPYGSWFDHVRNAEDFMKNHPDVPFHVLCFEKLKLEPVEEIRKLCHFLGKPDDLVEEMAKQLSFSQMKQMEKERMNVWDQGVCEQGSPGIFRKGEIGDWRNHFTAEQSAKADKVFEEKLKGYSFGDMVKPYMGL